MNAADLDRIAKALDPKATRVGDSWSCRCPAHDDKRASLTLTLKDGRLLWCCHANCSQADVQAELQKRGLLEATNGRTERTTKASTQKAADSWQPIMPVPDDAPKPTFNHFKLGAPAAAWTYRDREGRVLFYVVRFELHGGSKEVLPRCYGTLKGKPGYFWKAPIAPRPLYRLNQLAERPADMPVLVVEGEKTANAAAKLIEDHVAMTWQGGSKAGDKADWSPLQGRDVVIWPDADDPGRKAAQVVGRALLEIAATVRIVEPPADLPKGWDLADPVPDGIELDVQALLEQATPYDKPTTDEPDEPPEGICVTGGALAQIVRTAERLLAEASRDDPPTGVYQRGGLLMRIVRLPECSQASGIKRASGSMQILAAGADYLRLRLTDITPWLRFDARSKVWRQIDAPAEVARTLSEIAGMWPHTPSLAGIVQAPTLRPDGSILDRPGYDDATGLYFDPGATDFPAIPDRPTKRDAEAARDKLLEILSGFPFTDEASRAVALALLITPPIRNAVRAAPLFGITAPKMASGKTLLAHLAAYISTGHPPALMSQADDPQEEKKRLLALLLEGSVVSVIDNCERRLRSDALCTALTETTMRDRILGATRTITVPTTTTWIATGNNLLIDGDLSSRALLSSLDPRCERPEERDFAVDLHSQVPKRRGQLAAATLTITRAYLVADSSRPNIPTFGRFEAWSRFVREPLVWLGMADPCDTTRKIKSRDWVRNALGNFLETWHETFDATPQTVKAAIQLSETNEPLRTALETFGLDRGKLNPRKIGNFLAKYEGRIENGYHVQQAGTRSHAILWTVSRVSVVTSAPSHASNCQDYHARTRTRDDTCVESGGGNSQNSPNSPNGADRESVGTCPRCRFTVFRDNAVQTGNGLWLHPTCRN
jgi:putative DNA primase/helicase